MRGGDLAAGERLRQALVVNLALWRERVFDASRQQDSPGQVAGRAHQAHRLRTMRTTETVWALTPVTRRPRSKRGTAGPQVARQGVAAGLPAGLRRPLRLHQVREDIVDPRQVAFAFGLQPSEDPRVKAYAHRHLARPGVT